MTLTEYTTALRAARKAYPNLLLKIFRKIQRAYRDAAALASRAMFDASYRGLSQLTVQSWQQISRQLQRGDQIIQNAINAKTPVMIDSTLADLSTINIRYIMDAVETSGADKITQLGITNMFMAVNNQVLSITMNRVFQDGYTFSDRVWKAGEAYQEQIRRVIGAGLAGNRPVEKIARDIQVYTRDGKIAYANRFGSTLTRGTKEFMSRIGNKIDYRALRLIRSELYSSLQTYTKEVGRVNPANIGYDWILESGRQHWGCECPDIAGDTPEGGYTYESLPDYPHANCRCQVRQILKNHKDFMNDLETWTQGNSIPYLDDWYNNIYVYYAQ